LNVRQNIHFYAYFFLLKRIFVVCRTEAKRNLKLTKKRAMSIVNNICIRHRPD
jgi:hypothetical protein